MDMSPFVLVSDIEMNNLRKNKRGGYGTPHTEIMRKRFKLLFFMFTVVCACFTITENAVVFATEPEQPAEETSESLPEGQELYSPCLHITVQYSTGIAIMSGDTFLITYKMSGTDEMAQIELDASQLAGVTGKLDMNVGDYVVTNCEYVGNNADIIAQGFAITNTFSVTDDASSYAQLRLYIGTESATLLQKEYGDISGYKSGQPFTFEENATTEEAVSANDAATESQPDTEAPLVIPDDTEDQTSDETPEETQEATTEQDEKQDTYKFNPGKLIPIMVFAIVGALVILCLKKSGKL